MNFICLLIHCGSRLANINCKWIGKMNIPPTLYPWAYEIRFFIHRGLYYFNYLYMRKVTSSHSSAIARGTDAFLFCCSRPWILQLNIFIFSFIASFSWGYKAIKFNFISSREQTVYGRVAFCWRLTKSFY